MRLFEKMIEEGQFDSILGDESDLGYGNKETSLSDAIRIYHCLVWQEDNRRYCGYHDYKFLGRLAKRKGEDGAMPIERVRKSLIILNYFDLIYISNEKRICSNGIEVLKWWKPIRGKHSVKAKMDIMAKNLKNDSVETTEEDFNDYF